MRMTTRLLVGVLLVVAAVGLLACSKPTATQPAPERPGAITDTQPMIFPTPEGGYPPPVEPAGAYPAPEEAYPAPVITDTVTSGLESTEATTETVESEIQAPTEAPAASPKPTE